jgi:hypothetical protein
MLLVSANGRVCHTGSPWTRPGESDRKGTDRGCGACNTALGIGREELLIALDRHFTVAIHTPLRNRN